MSRDLVQVIKQLNRHLKTSVQLEGTVSDDGTFNGIATNGGGNEIEDFFQTLLHLGFQAPHLDSVMWNFKGPDNGFSCSEEFTFNIEQVLSVPVPSFVRCWSCEDRIFLPGDFEGDTAYCRCGARTKVVR